MLAWHLSHGIASVFQTLGIYDPRYQPLIQKGGLAVAALIGAGYISIPVSVQLGLLPLP
jgi:succinate dehydrogenase / fumarate reductase cytochrome b subunit